MTADALPNLMRHDRVEITDPDVIESLGLRMNYKNLNGSVGWKIQLRPIFATKPKTISNPSPLPIAGFIILDNHQIDPSGG